MVLSGQAHQQIGYEVWRLYSSQVKLFAVASRIVTTRDLGIYCTTIGGHLHVYF